MEIDTFTFRCWNKIGSLACLTRYKLSNYDKPLRIDYAMDINMVRVTLRLNENQTDSRKKRAWKVPLNHSWIDLHTRRKDFHIKTKSLFNWKAINFLKSLEKGINSYVVCEWKKKFLHVGSVSYYKGISIPLRTGK